jgi:replication factor C subunit 2/4
LRRAITMLQSLERIQLECGITAQNVQEMFGCMSMDHVVAMRQALETNDFEQIYRMTKELVANGYAAHTVMDSIMETILQDPVVLDKCKCRIAMLLGQADKRLMDGAEEELQLMHIMMQTASYLTSMS